MLTPAVLPPIQLLSPNDIPSWLASPGVQERNVLVNIIRQLFEHRWTKNENCPASKLPLSTWLEWILCSRFLTEAQIGIATRTRTSPRPFLESAVCNLPKRMCGYCFKPGDIAWNCRTCQADDTCVFCTDCFHGSDHKGHDVYFYHTQSGGCCDCGDPEAWKVEGFCVRHRGAFDIDPLPTIPAVLAETTRTLYREVFIFMAETIKISIEGFNHVEVPHGRTEPSVLILHNDDVHLLDDVNRSLMIMGFSAEEALNKAAIAHEEGQVILRQYPTSLDAVQACAGLRNEGLLVSVVPVSHQARVKVANELIDWATDVAYMTDAFTRIAYLELLALPPVSEFHPWGDCNTGGSPILRYLILAHSRVPKQMMSSLYGLYMALLADPKFKEEFAASYTAAYQTIYRDYVQNVGTHNETILGFGVQFLNRASFVSMLIERHKLFDVLLESLRLALVEGSNKFILDFEDPLDQNAQSSQTQRRVAQLLSEVTNASGARISVVVGNDDIGDGGRVIVRESDNQGNGHIQISQGFLNELLSNNIDERSRNQSIQAFLNDLVAAGVIHQTRFVQRQFTRLNLEHAVFSFRRYQNCIIDLKYALQIKGMASKFLSGVSHRYTSLPPPEDETPFSKLLSILRMLQGMDPHERQIGNHVEFDSLARLHAFDLSIHVGGLYSLILQSLEEFNVDSETHTEAHAHPAATAVISAIGSGILQHMLLWLRETNQDVVMPSKVTPTLAGDVVTFLYDVASGAVSCHLPLHRFFALLVREVLSVRHGLDILLDIVYRRCQNAGEEAGSCLRQSLYEYPLRAIVQTSQVRAGLWKRNGNVVVYQATTYAEPPCCGQLRDLDLILLQLAVLLEGPETVLTSILQRFQLLSWFLGQDEPPKPDCIGILDAGEENVLSLAEDCVELLIQLSSELPHPHTPDYTTFVIRREILHRLSVGPCTYSEIGKTVTQVGYGFGPKATPQQTNDILEGISIREASGGDALEPGRFKLKPDLYREYDPSFPHLTKNQHEIAVELWHHHRGKETEPMPVTQPYQMFHSQFARVTTLLFSKITIILVYRIFMRARIFILRLDEDKASAFGKWHSSGLIAKALHVLTKTVFVLMDSTLRPDPETASEYFQLIRDTTLVGPLSSQSLLQIILDLYQGPLYGSVGSNPAEEKYSDIDQLGVRWLLDQWCALDPECARAVQQERSTREASLEAIEQEKRKQELQSRKAEAQKRALDTIRRQQSLFAAQMQNIEDEDDEMNDVEPETIGIASDAQATTRESIHASTANLVKEDPNAPTCVMCRERSDKAIGFCSFAQKSFVLRDRSADSSIPDSEVPPFYGRQKLETPFQALHTQDSEQVHMRLCGHALHFSCFSTYQSLRRRDLDGRVSEIHSAINVVAGEFFCPVCKTISNAVVPYAPEGMFADSPGTASYLHILESFRNIPFTLKAGEEGDELVLAKFRTFFQQTVGLEGLQDALVRLQSSHTESWGRSQPSVTLCSPSYANEWKQGLIQLCSRIHKISTGKSSDATPADLDAFLPVACLSLSYTFLCENMSDPASNWQSAFENLKYFRLAMAHAEVLVDEHADLRAKLQVAIASLLLTGQEPSPAFASSSQPSATDRRISSVAALSPESSPPSINAVLSTNVLGMLTPPPPHASISEPRPLEAAATLRLEQLFQARSVQNVAFRSRPLLFMDLFKVMGLAITLSGNDQQFALQIVRLLCCARLGQILLTSCGESAAPIASGTVYGADLQNNSEVQAFARSLESIRSVLSVNAGVLSSPEETDAVSGLDLVRIVLKAYEPFVLASSWMLYTQFPGLSTATNTMNASGQGQFPPSLIALPSLQAVCQSSSLKEMMLKWSQSTRAVYLNADDIHQEIPRWLMLSGLELGDLLIEDAKRACGWRGAALRLFPLPESYTDLYSRLSLRTCPQCGKFPSRPAICLVCGALICASSSCPRRRPSSEGGGCTQHAKACGGGVCLFFLVMEATVLLIRGRMSAYFPSPYVDEYGEEHRESQRGRPLFLNIQRFQRLEVLWSSHQICAEVVRIRNSSDRVIREGYY